MRSAKPTPNFCSISDAKRRFLAGVIGHGYDSVVVRFGLPRPLPCSPRNGCIDPTNIYPWEPGRLAACKADLVSDHTTLTFGAHLNCTGRFTNFVSDSFGGGLLLRFSNRRSSLRPTAFFNQCIDMCDLFIGQRPRHASCRFGNLIRPFRTT